MGRNEAPASLNVIAWTSGRLTGAPGPCCWSYHLGFQPPDFLDHQVNVNNWAEVESPVKQTAADKLWNQRPEHGHEEPLRRHFPKMAPHPLGHSPEKKRVVGGLGHAGVLRVCPDICSHTGERLLPYQSTTPSTSPHGCSLGTRVQPQLYLLCGTPPSPRQSFI